MASESSSGSPSQYYIDEKWDAAIDTSLRRVVYGSLAGGVAALMLFRASSPPAATNLTAWTACTAVQHNILCSDPIPRCLAPCRWP